MSPWARGVPRGLSSSPVLKMATLRGRRTVTVAMPKEASSGSSRGLRRRPLASTCDPCARSSPRRRMFWPGKGAVRKVILLPPSCVSSCITTASVPAGTGAPVMMRMQ
ncbi:hypothetical protein D3C78_1699400 [compost metagenome]